MPVPSSGAISLNQFHVEAGGTSGTQCSINDSDIRALIGKASGATMSFNEWYGASAGNPYEVSATLVFTNIGGKYGQTTHEVSSTVSGSSFSDNTLNGYTVVRIWISQSSVGNFVHVDISGNTSASTLTALAGNRRYMRVGSTLLADYASITGNYQSTGNFTRYQAYLSNVNVIPQSTTTATFTWGT